MTDKQKLEGVQAKLLSSVENSYARMMKENVLEKLIVSTDKEGKLSFPIIIPLYEHDTEFLKETLKELGYSPEYKKEFNHFWQTTCYTISV